MPVTAVGYSQSEVVRKITQVYIKPNSLVLDCTYGEGLFWRECLIQHFQLVTSDLKPIAKVSVIADYTRLPFESETFNAIFFDPPYYGAPRGKRGIISKEAEYFILRRQVELEYLTALPEILRCTKARGLVVVKSSPGCINQDWLRILFKPFFTYERDFILIASNIHRRTDYVYSGHDYFHIFHKRGRVAKNVTTSKEVTINVTTNKKEIA